MSIHRQRFGGPAWWLATSAAVWSGVFAAVLWSGAGFQQASHGWDLLACGVIVGTLWGLRREAGAGRTAAVLVVALALVASVALFGKQAYQGVRVRSELAAVRGGR